SGSWCRLKYNVSISRWARLMEPRRMGKEPDDGQRGAPWKPGRQRRRGIYYRVEVYDQTSLCWLDAPGTFASIEDATEYIAREMSSRPARIMKIDGRKRSVVT